MDDINKTTDNTDDIDELQKEMQRIFEEVIYPEAEKQRNEDIINVGFTQDEFNGLLLFIGAFVYN